MLKVGFGSDIMTKERKSKKENINNFRILHVESMRVRFITHHLHCL